MRNLNKNYLLENMIFLQRFLNPLLLFICVIKVVQATENVKEQTITLNEGEELLIKCLTEADSFNIIFPRDDPEKGISTSTHELSFQVISGLKTEWTFRRKKTVFGDTGEYICYSAENQTILTVDNVIVRSRYYIYVKSTKNLFVQRRLKNKVLVPKFEQKLTIPCRPTAKDLKVQLIDERIKKVINHKNKDVTFNPEKGFILSNAEAVKHVEGELSCKIEQSSVSSQIFYAISSAPNKADSVQWLEIDLRKTTHPVLGQPLHLNCSYYVNFTSATDSPFWMTPRKDVRENVIIYREKYSGEEEKVTVLLRIKNLTMNDIGLYTCNVNSSTFDKHISAFINIYEDLDIQSSLTRNEIIEGVSMQMNCTSWIGDSSRKVQWLDSTNQSFVSDARKQVVYSEENIENAIGQSYLIKRAQLHINNISKSDAGEYYCSLVQEGQPAKVISYKISTIHASVPPEIVKTDFTGMKEYVYLEGRKVHKDITCEFKGTPKPVLTWYKDDVLLNTSTVKLEDELGYGHLQAGNDLFLLLVNPKGSGKYRCVGTNPFGQAEAFSTFLVIEKKLSTAWITIIVSFIVTVLVILGVYFLVRYCSEEEENKREDLNMSKMRTRASAENLLGSDQSTPSGENDGESELLNSGEEQTAV